MENCFGGFRENGMFIAIWKCSRDFGSISFVYRFGVFGINGFLINIIVG